MAAMRGREGTGSRWASPDTAADVLAHLRDGADENGLVEASFPGLGRDLHIGRSTAQRAIQRLLDKEHLELVRVGTGHRYPSRYRVLDGRPEVVTAA